MKVEIPELSLVVLMGASGSGKSTFARNHFKETEVVSSDDCRGIVSDDPNSQDATNDAFDLLHYIVRKRLSRGLLTVVDATNVQRESRKSLVALAREFHVLPAIVVLNLPPAVCRERNRARPDRQFGAHVVNQQASQLRNSLRELKREGFRTIQVLHTEEEIAAVSIERRRMWTDKRDEHGPFDLIGDVHGCRRELEDLLSELGYAQGENDVYAHAEGRRVIFLGDLVDRGPDSPGVLRIVMSMVAARSALCVPGNHDIKFMRKLGGRDVRVTHGLAETLRQMEAEPESFAHEVREFIDGLVSHFVLDDGKLVVAHAGLKAELQGRASRAVREFALYGETTGETDEFGLPVRYDWAQDYRGRAMVVYGHTPTPEAEWVNRTLCIDTGCVFGGRLSALRYPEQELVEVSAAKVYYEPVRPLRKAPTRKTIKASRLANVLDISDVSGKRLVKNRIDHPVTIQAENAAAALEVMSRFAVDPRWLIYLPPTMSPAEAAESGTLEHPSQCFRYFRTRRISTVVCQEKHMGSRAVVILCRDRATAEKRFGPSPSELGVIYTRTGRPFFDDPCFESALLQGATETLERAGFWQAMETDWACLDCELLPWTAKAKELLRTQYGPVGAASIASLGDAESLLAATVERDPSASALLAVVRERHEHVQRYREAYREYCWEVGSADDCRIAPFHVLATAGGVHTDRDHLWHMQWCEKLAQANPNLFRATRYRTVNLADNDSEAAACGWWEDLTSKGGEGIVVKPLQWIQQGKRGLVQPALKCRGPEYLRVIYGPEYRREKHVERLRQRNLRRKRQLATKEFALGLEALHRFVEGEPLYQVHECVFGVLALESEPVDPRL